MNQNVKQDPKSYALDAIGAFRIAFRTKNVEAGQQAFRRLCDIVNDARADLRKMADGSGIVLEDCPELVQRFISGEDSPEVWEATAEFIAAGLADTSFEDWPAGEAFVALVSLDEERF